jgi:hypothetical protein
MGAGMLQGFSNISELNAVAKANRESEFVYCSLAFGMLAVRYWCNDMGDGFFYHFAPAKTVSYVPITFEQAAACFEGEIPKAA